MKLAALLILIISIQGFAQSPVKQASFTTNNAAADKSRTSSAIKDKFSPKDANATTIRTYGEEKLDPRISELLKEEVSSLYKVKYITEIVKADMIDYNIELSNDKYWLIVKYNHNKTTGKTELTGRHMFGQ